MIYLAILLLVAALALGWVLTLLTLPGNWLMVLAAWMYAWLVPAGSAWDLSWVSVGVLLALATLGEVLEFVLGAAGAKQRGGSRRAALLAIVGGVVGATGGAIIGIPIPLIGPPIAAILGAAVGAFVGAVLGEQWAGRPLDHSMRVGEGAFWGRIWGTLAKTIVATVMVAYACGALVVGAMTSG